MTTTTLSPRTVAPGGGETVRVITDLITTKALAADTGGAYSLFETVTQPGQGSPPHFQRREEETFYILAGTYTFLLGERTIELAAGGYAFAPRGTVHAFTNTGDTPARMLILVTPGGIHENFFAELGESPDAPPPAGGPDVGRIVAVGAKYDVEILPPPA